MVYGTKGTMQVDYEDRIDFTRMREYREGRIQKLLEKSDFSLPDSVCHREPNGMQHPRR